MSFVAIGLNHASAPLDVLEQITIAPDELDKALFDLSLRTHISEAVVLSTCNRTEIYVSAERFHGAFQDVRDFLSQQSDVRPELLGDHLYTLYDEHAVEHLFRVSSGIDSAVLGEHEILGQVKRAWQAAQEHGCVGATLNSIFRAALEVGKRVRTETGIARSIASVSQAAIVLARDRVGSFDGQSLLLIGAGEMGGGMARSLADVPAKSLTIMSRTVETAELMAAEVRAQVTAFDDIENALVHCDVAFTSTAAPGVVLTADQLTRVVAQRDGRPLLIVDVAMPRDVDPAAASIDGVDLCDLEAVGAFVAAGLNSRQGELDAATDIVRQEITRYANQTGERSVAPVISSFRAHAEELRKAEIARFASRLDGLTAEQLAVVDELTKATLNKVLHDPTVRLKESATSLRGERLAAALRELFDLS